MRFYNTLTREIDEFEPLTPGQVRMYTCGPTVYDYAHIGNFRAYVFEDILRRHLKSRGFEVIQVMNLTDVDDKTIRGAKAQNLTLDEYTGRYKEAFFEDLDRLNIERAEYYPSATGHVDAMIGIIKQLLEKGCAYVSGDGSVYFDVSRFEDYGKLAHLDFSGLRAGARVAQDEYDKESVADFALWKAWSEEDGDVKWESPWGEGRPGWHIECSAMSSKYLGDSFDIHTGGVDNIFPHHENEIAQSECATGKQFVRYWLHCGYLVVEGKKMSKSEGNFYTLRQVMEKGYTGAEVRYVLLSGHYRQQLNFTFDTCDAARAALKRIEEFRGALTEIAGAGEEPEGSFPQWAEKGLNGFRKALDDDLNMPEALSSLFEMIRSGNKALASGNTDPAEAASALSALKAIDSILGVMGNEEETPGEVADMVVKREEARANRDFEQADAIRGKLQEMGWEIKDTAGGTQVKRQRH